MRTHRLRYARHDSVLDFITDKAEAKARSVVREPVILTRAGRRRPDLVAEIDDRVLIVDVTCRECDSAKGIHRYNLHVERQTPGAAMEESSPNIR